MTHATRAELTTCALTVVGSRAQRLDRPADAYSRAQSRRRIKAGGKRDSEATGRRQTGDVRSASFASVLLSIRQPGTWWVANSPLARNPTSERVVFFTLRQMPQRVAALRPALPRRPDRVRPLSTRRGVAQPLDAGVTQPSAATATTPAQVRHEPLSQLTPWPLSPRLVLPRPRNTPWYSVRARRSPFGLGL